MKEKEGNEEMEDKEGGGKERSKIKVQEEFPSIDKINL